MGMMTQLAALVLLLIGGYAGLHDIFGVHIIPYLFFEQYLAPLFVAFLFLFAANLSYCIYRRVVDPFKRSARIILNLAIMSITFGIFFTASMDKLSTASLLLGKILMGLGLLLAFVAIQKQLRLVRGPRYQRSYGQRQRIYWTKQ